MKPEPKQFRKLTFAVPAGFNVDAEAGILRNVVLLAGDREAKGHGLYIDDQTIETAHEAVSARKQLKGAMRHVSWEEYFSKGADRVLDFPGWFAGFSVKNKQLVAEKFEFYDSFRNDAVNGGAAAFARIMEMAAKTPDLFGQSIECWGYAVFVAGDGKEYGTKPDGVALKYDGVPALRVTDLFFSCFVDEPAATDGLFAKFSARFPAVAGLFGGKQNPAVADLVTQLRGFADALAAGSAVPPSAPNDSTSKSTMKIIVDLKAKLTDPKQFAAAMAIVGNTPAEKLATLTVGEVETQLAAEATREQITSLTTERDSFKSQVSTLTTERDSARQQVTSLTTERDDWKSKFEKLKKSGKADDVDLGAGGGKSTADESANPWLKATFNRSAQAELLKSDPERAKALKAAAAAEKK